MVFSCSLTTSVISSTQALFWRKIKQLQFGQFYKKTLFILTVLGYLFSPLPNPFHDQPGCASPRGSGVVTWSSFCSSLEMSGPARPVAMLSPSFTISRAILQCVEERKEGIGRGVLRSAANRWMITVRGLRIFIVPPPAPRHYCCSSATGHTYHWPGPAPPMVAVTTSSPVPTSISDINLDGGTGPDEIKPKENNKNRNNKNSGKAFLYFFLHTLMFYLFAESGPASLLKSTKNKITGPASKLLSKKSGQIVLQSAASGKTSVPVVYQLPGNWKVPQNSRAFFLNWTNYSVTESLPVNITMLLFFKNGLAA